jgi:hypothetical protein
MNCLRSLGRCDLGFESHLGHGRLVCACVCVCVCARARAYSVFCVVQGLSLVQGVLPIVYRSKCKMKTSPPYEYGIRGRDIKNKINNIITRYIEAPLVVSNAIFSGINSSYR